MPARVSDPIRMCSFSSGFDGGSSLSFACVCAYEREGGGGGGVDGITSKKPPIFLSDLSRVTHLKRSGSTRSTRRCVADAHWALPVHHVRAFPGASLFRMAPQAVGVCRCQTRCLCFLFLLK